MGNRPLLEKDISNSMLPFEEQAKDVSEPFDPMDNNLRLRIEIRSNNVVHFIEDVIPKYDLIKSKNLIKEIVHSKLYKMVDKLRRL